jgi:hypothetical protein
VILRLWWSSDIDSLPNLLAKRVTFCSPVTDYHSRRMLHTCWGRSPACWRMLRRLEVAERETDTLSLPRCTVNTCKGWRLTHVAEMNSGPVLTPIRKEATQTMRSRFGRRDATARDSTRAGRRF